MKVYQILYNEIHPSFLQIAVIGELETKAENAEEIFDALNGEPSPRTHFLPSKEWIGYIGNNVVFPFKGQWCSWHPLTGELRTHDNLEVALEELVADIKYLIRLRYVDLS